VSNITDGKEPIFIKDWEELSKINQESETHILEISTRYGCGRIKLKSNPDEYSHYLTTHSFYGSFNKYSTDILRECGFNVTLANWDKDE